MTRGDPTQTVPSDFAVRMRIRDATRQHVRDAGLRPPQTLARLRHRAGACLEALDLAGRGFDHFTMILLNNALWESYFPSIPRERRLLLLPFCLRHQATCPAPRDDLGLVCAGCGACSVPTLSEEAERLGMPVLVAESSSRVADWVERGDIEAVVGVSCLASLEKAFPSMLRHAVPGLAIPLTVDGCADTAFDPLPLRDALAIPEDGRARTVPFAAIRERMARLFTEESVRRYIHAGTGALRQFPSEIFRALCAHGKHHRPAVVYGCYAALSEEPGFPGHLEPLALAVECFHKASLIHDDMEDGDDTRYGEPALHKRIGAAAALNAGDFLIGEGYRLLGHEAVPASMRAELVAEAARAHGELSLGQAREFEARVDGDDPAQRLETHRLKTAPAFRVALAVGAIAAGRFEAHRALFHRFADALGVAYQLSDDLDDDAPNPASAVDALMLSTGGDRAAARAEIAALRDTYTENAYDVLEETHDTVLKLYLHRLAGKVLSHGE